MSADTPSALAREGRAEGGASDERMAPGRYLVDVAREVVDGGMRRADRTIRVPPEFRNPRLTAQPVVLEDSTGKRRSDVEDQFDRLLSLHAADHPGRRADDARLLAGLHRLRLRRISKEAAQARPAGEDRKHLSAP